jgi:glutathione synthase/RimK-type ligase-like ATP-grasp enzyme
MILLIGTDADQTLIHFIKFLRRKKAKYVFLDQKYLLQDIDLLDNALRIKDKTYCYQDFSGVLNRMAAPAEGQDLHIRYEQTMSYLFNILTCKLKNVFNDSYAGVTNDSKIFQLSLLKLNHIKKPEHIVLCNKDVVSNLPKSYKSCIVKSLSSIRSEVVEFHANKKKYFQDKSSEPVLFQKTITGPNIRVHVVIDKAFAVKIKSSTIDYRYDSSGNRTFSNYTLEDEIAKECIDIASQLNLKFTGIDLIKNETGYYILEANPSPGWSYFEESVDGEEVSEKLYKELSR